MCVRKGTGFAKCGGVKLCEAGMGSPAFQHTSVAHVEAPASTAFLELEEEEQEERKSTISKV